MGTSETLALAGVWNGIVDQVAGLSDTAGIISDLFSGGDRISELWTGLKKLDVWCTETQGPNNVCIWSLIKKAHTGQTCQVAEQVGVDAANVLTIAISFAKIGQVAKVAQLMESLDAMSQVLKLTSKVIKPVLVGTGKATKIVFKVTKAFLQPGVKFTKLNGRLFSVLIPIPIDLTPNLEAAINKAKELLAKNKEAFDLEIQIKKDAKGVEITDQNGNLVAEIEVDGQKIEVLVNPDESKLKESAEEIVSTAGKVLDDIVLAMKVDFPSTWKFNKIGDDAFEVLDGAGKKWGTVYNDKIICPARTQIGTAGNPILNKAVLVKNMRYEVDGIIYQSDELGRVLTTTADLDDIARVRLGNQQIRAVDVKDGVRGVDQGGHIVGSRFFGPGEQINLYPQSANLNQGPWKTMENSWADAMVAGKDVKIEVKAIFEGTSKRPSKFEVEYWIDGKYKLEKFDNL